MNKLFILALSLIFCISCTGMLWDKSSYTENIHSLYIDESDNSFVVLGDSYHYIFKAKTNLLNILKTSKEIKIHPSFYYFDLSEDNMVSGKFDLYAYKSEITESDVSLLKNLGFDDSTSYNHEMLWHKVYIKGTRYKINSKMNFGSNLHKEYSVKIFEPRTDGAAKTTGKIVLTPITVSADVVLGITAGVLYGITFK